MAKIIYCDSCGASFSVYIDSGNVSNYEVKKRARRRGWKVGKNHICPDCNENNINWLKGGAE